jgi:hypothetical protein
VALHRNYEAFCFGADVIGIVRVQHPWRGISAAGGTRRNQTDQAHRKASREHGVGVCGHETGIGIRNVSRLAGCQIPPTVEEDWLGARRVSVYGMAQYVRELRVKEDAATCGGRQQRNRASRPGHPADGRGLCLLGIFGIQHAGKRVLLADVNVIPPCEGRGLASIAKSNLGIN